jgi:hypothetical protein
MEVEKPTCMRMSVSLWLSTLKMPP